MPNKRLFSYNPSSNTLCKVKTLKSQLLKKLLIKFYETQDLSSPNGKPELLFYD